MGERQYDDRFWAKFFHHYDFLNEVPPYQELQDRVAQLCAPGPTRNILDAGAGTGNLVTRLRQRGAEVVALDANRHGLRLARTKSSGLGCLQATLESALPFRDAAFDAVACINVLFSLTPQGRERSLREFRRVLKAGGRLVVATPVVKTSPLRIYAKAVRQWVQQDGLLRGGWRTARAVPKAAALLFYASRIVGKGRAGTYQFDDRDSLSRDLAGAGFAVEGTERIYADQLWLAWARAQQA